MSGRNLAVIMDPLESIKPHKDSTLPMLLEAQRRDWNIHYATLDDIWLRGGEAWGRVTGLRVQEDLPGWYARGKVAVAPLSQMDVILMRKDPPFNLEYIFATYILERAEDHGACVVNRPQSLRDANEKAFIAWFPNCIPPTFISRSLEAMREFTQQQGQVVVKPLDLMAGQSVFITGADDGNYNVILETVTQQGSRYAVVQKYLPEVRHRGDKRILLVDGQPIPVALVRIPSPDDHRGNLATGAQATVKPLTERDRWLCEQIGPVLRDRGLIFAGIDVIGDFITEINVTSPTGIRELQRGGATNIAQRLFDAICHRLA